MLFNIETIMAAAKWWANQLRAPVFDNGVAEHEVLANLLQSSKPTIPDEKIEAFQNELMERLLGSDIKTLSVDYGPDQILRDAAEIAGIYIDTATFPWKTCMILSDTVLKVACGYGAPFEVIYGNEEA